MTKPKIVSRGRVVWASFVTGWAVTIAVLGLLAMALNSNALGTAVAWAIFGPILAAVVVAITLTIVGMFVELWDWALGDPSRDDEDA